MKPLIIFLILFLHANSQLQINWVKCNVTFTASKATDIFPNSFPWNPTGNSDKIDTSDILCAYIKVPLFWSKPTGPKITFHIYKKPSKSANKKGQLWVLNGGPGGDGRSIYPYTADILFNSTNGDYDIIVPDHRGTGFSNRMGCPQEKDPNFHTEISTQGKPGPLWRACIDHLRRTVPVDGFSITEASNDVYHVSQALKRPSEEILVYGVSYGTMLAHRILQIYPNAFDSVFLDGICPPEKCMISTYDQYVNKNGIEFFEKCKKEPSCERKFPNLAYALRNVQQNLVNPPTTCQVVYRLIKDRRRFKIFLSSLLSNPYFRLVVPSIILRLSRCNPADVRTLIFFLSKTGFISSKQEGGDSLLLSSNIILSEMLFNGTVAPRMEDIFRFQNTSYFTVSGSVNNMAIYHENIYPAYPKDQYYGRYARTNAPVLLMNGDLDHATPLEFAQHLHEKMGLKPENLVLIPNGAHGLIIFGDYQQCSLEIGSKFLMTKKIDTSCISKIPEMDWEGKSPILKQISKEYFDLENIWN